MRIPRDIDGDKLATIPSRFISLERLVEENRGSYYRNLHQSSQDWHDSRHDIAPRWHFFLFIVDCAYREFAEAVESQMGHVCPGPSG